jgi:CelD/BcsL family acetyltransferase involved in cellulose biosynthesis
MTLTASFHGDLPEARPPGLTHASARADEIADEIAVAIIETPADFLALQGDWDALFARAALPHQVFQCHSVLRHWMRHYLDERTGLRVVTARQAGRLVMAWPLVRERRFGLVSLRFMGVPVAQFGDVLVERSGDEAALLQAGWDAVAQLGADLLELRKLRADSVLASSGLVSRAVVRERLDAPFADLARRVGTDGPSPAYASRERSNHRRRLRRLSERGAIDFTMAAPGTQAAELVAAAVAMKQAALLRHGVLAPTISDPRFAAFFRGLAGDAAGGSPLRIAIISCDGEPIGLDLSLDCKGTSFGHVIATHPGHERGGVGGLLVYHSFACARARGSVVFDLLAPADAYKLEHADGMTEVTDRVLPLSWRGRLAVASGLQNWRPLLKRTLRRLPAPLTRRLAAWSNSGKG